MHYFVILNAEMDVYLYWIVTWNIVETVVFPVMHREQDQYSLC